MIYFAAALLLLLMLLAWASIFFSLPGNWINVALLGLWKLFYPEMPAGWWFFLGLLLLAAIGEALEFASQWWGGKRYGGSSRGNWGSLAGALVGAIVGAPFFLGVGALVGAVAGAFLGSLILELVSGKEVARAIHASKGAMLGRVLGFAAKAGLGMVLIVLALPKVWP
ncbi:MAG: DUF456 domain-containing protein [Desulfohalobiaceae bacterium]|nr:DUF456 domain-containing protein [Desulfohalobiaceae bacterium]